MRILDRRSAVRGGQAGGLATRHLFKPGLATLASSSPTEGCSRTSRVTRDGRGRVRGFCNCARTPSPQPQTGMRCLSAPGGHQVEATVALAVV
eukprot:scaffold6270_cov215-Prasinococcus_capsulatus_cf.AAC.4